MSYPELDQHVHILIIDDDALDRASVRRTLKASGLHATLIEADGHEAAMEALRQTVVDCILLDYQLPGMDGGEVLRTLRATGIQTPVIILTGHGDEQVAVDLMKSGAADYLAKSRITTEALASSIRHTLRLAHVEQQAQAAHARQYAAEAALRHQEQVLASIVRSIGDAVIATDANGHVIFLNQGAERLTGWEATAAVGQPIQVVLPLSASMGQDAPVDPVAEVLQSGAAVEQERVLLLRRNGSHPIPVDTTSAPISGAQGQSAGVVVVLRDVRSQVQAAERLRVLAAMNEILVSSLSYRETLPQLAELLVEHIADCCTIDLRESDGRIERVAMAMSANISVASNVITALAGVEDSYGPGKVLQTVQPTYYPNVWHDLEGQLRSDHHAFIAETGLTSWFSVPLMVRGSLLGVLSLGRHEEQPPFVVEDVQLGEEIARRTAMAVENALLYQQAQEAIQTRDAFLSIAAHELKNPLAALQGYSELLQRRLQRQGQLALRDQPMLEKMTDQARRLNRLIQALFDVSRLQLGQLEIECVPVDLGLLTSEILQTLEPTLEQHTLRSNITAGPLLVLGDALRLEQVIANLLQNAIKYSPKGGTITVEVTADEESVVLHVQDEGIGIPESALDSIFQRFYRAPNTDTHGLSGMGVGLYVVRQIIDLHQGRISVASRQGQGSTFSVWLPRMKTSAA